MYGLGAENNFVLDPEQLTQFVGSEQFRESMNRQLAKKLAAQQRKKRMVAWGIGLGVAAALGVGGWFVYTRYVQE